MRAHETSGYWKFSFWDLFETQRCGACGGKFSVPLTRQYLIFLLSIAFSLPMVWLDTYCMDLPSRIGRFFSALVVMALWVEGVHIATYRTYLRAFRRAQAAMPKSTKTT